MWTAVIVFVPFALMAIGAWIAWGDFGYIAELVVGIALFMVLRRYQKC